MTALETLRQQTTAWVAADDFAVLLKIGLVLADAKECLLRGVHGKYMGVTVWIDRELPKGRMKLADGTVLDAKFD